MSLLMRSVAGGETGAPPLHRGTRLKATTEQAFLETPTRMPEQLKGLVLHCRARGWDSADSMTFSWLGQTSPAAQLGLQLLLSVLSV